jgi:hypothetical protein
MAGVTGEVCEELHDPLAHVVDPDDRPQLDVALVLNARSIQQACATPGTRASSSIVPAFSTATTAGRADNPRQRSSSPAPRLPSSRSMNRSEPVALRRSRHPESTTRTRSGRWSRTGGVHLPRRIERLSNGEPVAAPAVTPGAKRRDEPRERERRPPLKWAPHDSTTRL